MSTGGKFLHYILLGGTIMFFLFEAELNAQDWGLVRSVDSTVNVRAQRSADSSVVFQLSPGELVKVDFLEGSWWAVFRVDETERNQDKALGYIYAPLLRPVAKKNMKIWGSQAQERE